MGGAIVMRTLPAEHVDDFRPELCGKGGKLKPPQPLFFGVLERCRMFLDVLGHCRMFLDVLGHCQMFLDVLGRYRMFLDVLVFEPKVDFLISVPKRLPHCSGFDYLPRKEHKKKDIPRRVRSSVAHFSSSGGFGKYLEPSTASPDTDLLWLVNRIWSHYINQQNKNWKNLRIWPRLVTFRYFRYLLISILLFDTSDIYIGYWRIDIIVISVKTKEYRNDIDE
ncbi:unnamed protein product [Nesidiocoris tenuis]|uniref:Uncharacterized protein n=1 Tax=Nesidiocoris tenuis TaxID=355587 RepID=A0A6H5H6P7_9HEMI|nr:unnamed protein product [Nesidiocoris tenuis]